MKLIAKSMKMDKKECKNNYVCKILERKKNLDIYSMNFNE